MAEPKVIEQGQPISKYFKVFVPPGSGIGPGDRVLCRHPVSKVETQGEVAVTMQEPWLKIPDWICLDAYGLNAMELKQALESRFPEFAKHDYVRILMIKKD